MLSRVQEGGIIRHTSNHNVMFLGTTNREDYKPPFEYKPYAIVSTNICLDSSDYVSCREDTFALLPGKLMINK